MTGRRPLIFVTRSIWLMDLAVLTFASPNDMFFSKKIKNDVVRFAMAENCQEYQLLDFFIYLFNLPLGVLTPLCFLSTSVTTLTFCQLWIQ